MRLQESARLQMERSIDDLAELARSGVEPGRFFAEVLRRALHPGGAAAVVLWRPSLEGRWDIAGEMPAGAPVDSDRIAERQELLDEVAGGSQPRIIAQPAETTTAGETRVFSPLRHAESTVGVLETSYQRSSEGGLSPSTVHFLSALAEITADFLSQQELQQLRRARSTWQQWDQYQLRLGQSLELDAVSAVAANDGRVLLGCERITVLVRHGRRYRVQAISGVERPDVRSGSVRSLELLAKQVAVRGQTVWASPEAVSAGTAPGADVDLYRRESGAACFGVVPLVAAAESVPGDLPDAVLIFENFTACDGWAEMQSRAESLVQRSSFCLRAAIERQDVPWLGAWQRLRTVRRLARRPGLILTAASLGAIIAALILVPAELTVTGQAEMWPDVRRDVFASTSGIVDAVLVKHGDEVQPDQPLVVLRDPDLEQEVPRIAGEIATTRERLRGVQIARLTAGTTAEALARVRQLPAEEEELKERLKTLERQRILLDERQKGLTLRSPIAGRVLTWDTSQHLLARPVERGQSLLTVGETSGPWVMEVQVADRDAGHMLRAQQSQGPDLEVEFQLPSEPGQTHRGRVRGVALASESTSGSHGTVRVVVQFDRDQVAQLRPGATAVPRIRCGRQSLGYVWLHDLIDAIRIRLLF